MAPAIQSIARPEVVVSPTSPVPQPVRPPMIAPVAANSNVEIVESFVQKFLRGGLKFASVAMRWGSVLSVALDCEGDASRPQTVEDEAAHLEFLLHLYELQGNAVAALSVRLRLQELQPQRIAQWQETVTRGAKAASAAAEASVPPANPAFDPASDVDLRDLPIGGRIGQFGGSKIAALTPHGTLFFMKDTTHLNGREGFLVVHRNQRPVFVSLMLMRRVVQDRTLLRFYDTVTSTYFYLKPVLSGNPRIEGHYRDEAVDVQPSGDYPYTQVVGVEVGRYYVNRPEGPGFHMIPTESAKLGEVEATIPWTDGWMSYSPMSYRPEWDSQLRWVRRVGSKSDRPLRLELTHAASELLRRIPNLKVFDDHQKDGLTFLALALGDPRMDRQIGRLAIEVILNGPSSAAWLGDHIQDGFDHVSDPYIYDFPGKSIFVDYHSDDSGSTYRTERHWEAVQDAAMPLSTMAIGTIQEWAVRAHDLFPGTRDARSMYPSRNNPTR